MVRTKSRRICRAGAEGVFRRNAISRESPVHQRQVGGLEPTVAREHVCGPDVISTATVNGAREISAGRSPLAKQVARAVRARQNHAGGVPANCGLVSPEAKPSREIRLSRSDQVARRATRGALRSKVARGRAGAMRGARRTYEFARSARRAFRMKPKARLNEN